MTTTDLPHRLNGAASPGRLLLRFTLGLLRWAESGVAQRSRRTAHHPLTVTVVDDPTGPMRLIGVRGVLDADTVSLLAAALVRVEECTALHLDLTGAQIIGAPTLLVIERLIDRLELLGVNIRIVGLDPRHPALASLHHR